MSEDSNEQDKVATGDATQENAGKGEKMFTQAELDAQIKHRLEREQRKSQEAADKARKEAEEKALADNAKWQELAEKREKELGEVAPYKERAERYEAALNAQLTKAREGLPKAVLTLLDRLDAAEQLEYIAQNRDELMPKEETETQVGYRPAPHNSTGRDMSRKEADEKRGAGMLRAWKGM